MSATRGNIIKYFTDIQNMVLAHIDEEVKRMTEAQRREQLQRINMMKGEVGKMFDGLINQTNQITFRSDGSIAGPVGMGSYGYTPSSYHSVSKPMTEWTAEDFESEMGFIPNLQVDECSWYNLYDKAVGNCKTVKSQDPVSGKLKEKSVRVNVSFDTPGTNLSAMSRPRGSASYSSASESPSASSLSNSSIYGTALTSPSAPAVPTGSMSSADMSSSSMMPISGGNKKKTSKVPSKSRKGPRNPVASAKRKTK